MKITLYRQMRLNVAELFLSLEREVPRTDIKEYLNGNVFESAIVNNGVRNYLKKTGIYDEDFRLTKYGSTVKETGIFKAKEMGKYRVWLDLDNHRIIFLHRVSPVDRDHDRLFQIEAIKEGFSIPTNREDFYRFELRDPEKITGKFVKEEDCHVEETIYINGDGSSTVFSGHLRKNLPVSVKPVPENVESKDSSVWNIIEAMFQDDWDKNARRLRIQLGNINNSNDIENFEMDRSGNWLRYTYTIDKIPIEPYNSHEAVEWRNRLLNKEIAQSYLTDKSFDRLVLSINGKEGFSSYKHTMDKPEMKTYLKGAIEPNSTEFWHLCAPMDLNPGIQKDIIVDRFEIVKGSTSMLEIVSKINIRDPEFVFYCDVYTDRNHQQKIIAAFLDATGAKSKYLLTKTLQNKDKRRSLYLESQRKDIRVKLWEVQKQKHQGRCIVFCKNGNMNVWNLDDSADYINYNVDEKTKITPTDIGEIERPVVFTMVSDKVLNNEILNFIKQEVKDV